MPALRKYRPQDFERLLELDRACFVEGIAYTRDEMRYFLTLPSALTLVATDDGASEHAVEKREKVQGFIIADRDRRRRSSRAMGRIITIDVAASARSAGLGTLLLTAAENELRQAACDYVVLEVAVDNHAALRFYKKHGYSVLKLLPRYYLDSMDGLLMGKRL